MAEHFVYILRNTSGKHYIGETENLERRLVEHNRDNGHFSGYNGPWELVVSHICNGRTAGKLLERKLKSFKNPSYAIRYLTELNNRE